MKAIPILFQCATVLDIYMHLSNHVTQRKKQVNRVYIHSRNLVTVDLISPPSQTYFASMPPSTFDFFAVFL